ncbi:MAG: glycine cleavage T C-terminal barrel domain-containing protein, partial [Pseudomonadota bacterium]
RARKSRHNQALGDQSEPINEELADEQLRCALESRVGYVTSGGYGHSVGKSLAMAMIQPELTEPGTELSTHIVGVEKPTRVIDPSPYDPAGKAMRL